MINISKYSKVELQQLIEKPISGEWGKEAIGTGVKVIRSTNFTNTGKINEEKGFAIRSIDEKKVKKKSLKPGDIIIEKSGGSPKQPVGRVLYFDLDDDTYLFSNFTSLLRPKANTNPKFLHFGLFACHKFGITEMFQNKTTGIINLQLDRYLNTVQIPLPPLETQKEIAHLLDTADALRQKTQEQLDHLDTLAQSIFLEMFGDPVLNEKGWEVKAIGDFADVSSGSTPKRSCSEYYTGDIPWVKTGEVDNGYIEITEEYLTELGIKESSCKVYPTNSILIAMYGQGKTRGKVGLIKVPAATNQACAVIEANQNYNTTYLFEYLKNSYAQLRLLGRGGNQPNLNVGMIKKYKVMMPEIPVQEKFGSIILNIETQKEKLRQSLKECEELFNCLLQDVFG